MVFIVLPEMNKLRLRQNRSKIRLRPSGSGAQHYNRLVLGLLGIIIASGNIGKNSSNIHVYCLISCFACPGHVSSVYHIMLCCTVSYPDIPYHFMPCHIPYHAISYHITPYHTILYYMSIEIYSSIWMCVIIVPN